MNFPFTRCSEIVYHITQIWSYLSKILFDWCIFTSTTFTFNIFITEHTINFFWFIMVYSVSIKINFRPFYRFWASKKFWPFYRLKYWCWLVYVNPVLFKAVYFVFIQKLINFIFCCRRWITIIITKCFNFLFFPLFSIQVLVWVMCGQS